MNYPIIRKALKDSRPSVYIHSIRITLTRNGQTKLYAFIRTHAVDHSLPINRSPSATSDTYAKSILSRPRVTLRL